jgi:hypothetical protein
VKRVRCHHYLGSSWRGNQHLPLKLPSIWKAKSPPPPIPSIVEFAAVQHEGKIKIIHSYN